MFHAYCAYGIAILLGVQAFFNMGVNMGLLPTKGLTLPLVSYGGSSLAVSCMCIGIIARIQNELCQSKSELPSDVDKLVKGDHKNRYSPIVDVKDIQRGGYAR